MFLLSAKDNSTWYLHITTTNLVVSIAGQIFLFTQHKQIQQRRRSSLLQNTAFRTIQIKIRYYT
jgi:hypothetical protein